jgi:DNA-binding response OmpR family regulator
MVPHTDDRHISNSRSNKSILVLDDELDITSIIERFLQGLGFRVSTFTDPIVALEYSS